MNQWPLSDENLAKLLDRIQSYKPAVIGLDLYRDIDHPPGQELLARQLAMENVYGIYDVGVDPSRSAFAPQNMNPNRTGFSDFVVDQDGMIRRNFLFASIASDKFYSFGLQLSLHVLRQRYHEEVFSANLDGLKIAETFLPTLKPKMGGYQFEDAAGYQIMLQYHTRHNAIRQISLSNVLEDQVNPLWLKDKVVLIGSVAPSIKDNFFTPEKKEPVPGVLIQAQQVQQILSAVIDKKPLIKAIPEGLEILMVIVYSIFSSLALRRFARNQFSGLLIILGSIFLILFLHSVVLLYLYVWIPVVPSALACATLIYQWGFRKN